MSARRKPAERVQRPCRPCKRYGTTARIIRRRECIRRRIRPDGNSELVDEYGYNRIFVIGFRRKRFYEIAVHVVIAETEQHIARILLCELF